MASVENGYAYDKCVNDDDIRAILHKLKADKEIVESAGEYGWRG